MKKGSIRQRGNKYQITIDIEIDPITKKRKRHYQTFNTRKEAEIAIEEIIGCHQEKKNVESLEIIDFLNQWLELSSRNLSPNTIYVYKSYIKLLSPYFKEVRINEIKRLQAEVIINDLLKHYKPSTVNLCRRLLATAYNRAVDWELVEKNPFKGIRIKREKKKYTIWTPEQIQHFLAAAKYKCVFQNGSWSYYLAFLIAIYTGMRKSEVIGLRWENVDLNNKTIHVKEALHESNKDGKKYVGDPKTESSNRKIIMSNLLVNELKNHKEFLGEKIPNPPNDYIIVTKDFKPIHQRNLTKRMHDIIKDEGLPKIRFHDLRHTHASILLANGINIKVAQERLGHSRTDMLLNVYSHVFPSAQKEAAELFDILLE